MKHLIVVLSVITSLGTQTLKAQDDKDILIGKKFAIHSKILNEERTILVSLPDSYTYESGSKSYPVLILLDGYTHFKTVSSTVHFMSSTRNRNDMIPEMIIVAIENMDRERDFTVTKLKTKRVNTMGGGRNFLAYIETELIPYIDQQYNTKNHRILVGHSLGGLLTLNAFMTEKSLFNAFIAIDPSIWWDEQLIKEKVNSIPSQLFSKKLYIATANQGPNKYERNKKRHDLLFDNIKTRAKENLNTKLDYFENESHRSVPLIAIYEGLKFLYKE